MPIKRRIGNAAVMVGVGAIVVGFGWLLSMGMYALGLWPLGALLRVGCWIFAIWCAYWAVRHLVEGEDEISRKHFEQWQKKHPDA